MGGKSVGRHTDTVRLHFVVSDSTASERESGNAVQTETHEVASTVWLLPA